MCVSAVVFCFGVFFFSFVRFSLVWLGLALFCLFWGWVFLLLFFLVVFFVSLFLFFVCGFVFVLFFVPWQEEGWRLKVRIISVLHG